MLSCEQGQPQKQQAKSSICKEFMLSCELKFQFKIDGPRTFGNKKKDTEYKNNIIENAINISEYKAFCEIISKHKGGYFKFDIVVYHGQGGKKFDLDNIAKLIIDAFSKEFRGEGLYDKDNVDYVKEIHLKASKIDGNNNNQQREALVTITYVFSVCVNSDDSDLF